MDQVLAAVEQSEIEGSGGEVPDNWDSVKSFFDAANEMQKLYQLKILSRKKEIENKILEDIKKYFIGSRNDSFDRWIEFFESDIGKELVEIRALSLGAIESSIEKIGEEVVDECLKEMKAREQASVQVNIRVLLENYRSQN